MGRIKIPAVVRKFPLLIVEIAIYLIILQNLKMISVLKYL